MKKKGINDALQAIYKKQVGFSWDKSSTPLKIIGSVGIGFIALSPFGGVIDISTENVSNSTTSDSIINVIGDSNNITITQIASVGGFEYEQLKDVFIPADENYFCNGQEWGLRAGEEASTAYYASSTSLGADLVVDFAMNSSSPSFVLGRPELYEIVAGEGGMSYLSLKSLKPDGGLLELSTNGFFDGIKSRVRIRASLLDVELNSLIVREKINENGDKLQLLIYLNDQEFVSEELQLVNTLAYKSIYMSIVDRSFGPSYNNATRAVYLPLLGPCS